MCSGPGKAHRKQGAKEGVKEGVAPFSKPRDPHLAGGEKPSQNGKKHMFFSRLLPERFGVKVANQKPKMDFVFRPTMGSVQMEQVGRSRLQM